MLLGVEVDPFNTVHFSNHTGYGKFAGTTQTAADFDKVMDCMEANDLVHYSHVLSGFARGVRAPCPKILLLINFTRMPPWCKLLSPPICVRLEGADFLQSVAKYIRNIKDSREKIAAAYTNPDAGGDGAPHKRRREHAKFDYFCDPVLGDNGKLYVPEEVVPVYRQVGPARIVESLVDRWMDGPRC